MNGTDRLERELTAWFDDVAAPRVPDYRADILASTATMRQRPHWSFPARWLPRAVAPRVPSHVVRPVPWRTIVLLAVLGLLLAATVALTVGSRSRTPAPFGPAVNGLVTYADDGDIWTVDPATGIRTPIVIGEEADTYPRFSRDGNRIAFFRKEGVNDRLVVTNVEGTHLVVSSGDPFSEADPDSIVWSPSGDYVAVAADGRGRRTTYLVDTAKGSVRDLQTPSVDVEVYWRPLVAGQILFSAKDGFGNRLLLLDVTDPEAEAIEVWEAEPNLRPGGWTPDGQRFIVHHFNDDRAWTDLVDPETGATESLDVDYGRVSNDGTRIVGYSDEGKSLCVMLLPDGSCDPIATGTDLVPNWEHTTALHWSPDDRWIAVLPQAEEGGWVLLDPAGGPPVKPDWAELGIESWQRTATWSWW